MDYEKPIGYARPLTLQMIRRLHRELGIPTESLIKETGEQRAA